MNEYFVQRWKERGDGSTDGYTLFMAIKWSIENDRMDLVEKMFYVHENRYLWRFKSVDGNFFFAIVEDTEPVTVLTRDMMKHLKGTRKKKFYHKVT